ncbi:transcription factor bHLH148-like [Primulina eburnea]|uniref:transcription factor bHLH148-like n=1 Tax=Primulina eburnea TaxID=1245227 RepID=UPI003C6C1455
MTSSMVSSPAASFERSSTRRKRKKKIASQEISLNHHGNNDNLPQTSLVQWRSDAQQQVYSSKLFQAIRQVQRGDSSAPKMNRAVREAADRVLAATARGRSRWSRAMLTNRLRLRFLKKKNITKQQRKVEMMASGSGGPPRRSKVSVTRLKWKSMQTVQRKARVLGGLVPGCRKQPLPVVLEEVTDYIAALEMQVRAMSALASLLSGSGPTVASGAVDGPGSSRTPSI